MMKSVKALVAAVSAIAAGAVALSGNLDKLSQLSLTGPLYTLLQVARPELFFVLMLLVVVPFVGKVYAVFQSDVRSVLQQRKWLVTRLKGSLAASCAALALLLSFTTYEGYYYAKGKMFAWTYKGRGLLAVADRQFLSGRPASAKALLEYCSKTLGSSACESALDALTTRQRAGATIDRLLNIVPFSPGSHAALLVDRLQVSYDTAQYEGERTKMLEKVHSLNARYLAGLGQIRQSTPAIALATLEAVNTESPGYRDVHRFVDELRKATKQKRFGAPYDAAVFPYLAAAVTLPASDIATVLELVDPDLPAVEDVLVREGFADVQ